MKADYVTKSEFKIFKSEFKKFEAKTDANFKSIDLKFDVIDKRFGEVDKRFDVIDKRFDEMHVFIRDCMEEQRIHYADECTRYIGSLYEKFSAQVSAILEHPVFTAYKA